MSRQEYWANVYRENDESWVGLRHPDRKSAEEARCAASKTVAVVIVKLKPDGAPRRYASEHDRRNWEAYPEEMRKCPF